MRIPFDRDWKCMPYLIDGNNVIGQIPGWHLDKPESRHRLLAQLARFAECTKARVTVVFDGAPDPKVPDGSLFRTVRVYYPGRGSDADTLIERLVARSTDRRKLIVVTSDRQLAASCRSAGAQTVRSGEFRKFMAEATRETPREPDPGEFEREAPIPGTVDEWLRYFGYDASKAREPDTPPKAETVRAKPASTRKRAATHPALPTKKAPTRKSAKPVEPRKRKLGPAFEKHFLSLAGERDEEPAHPDSLADWARYLGMSLTDIDAPKPAKSGKRSRKKP